MNTMVTHRETGNLPKRQPAATPAVMFVGICGKVGKAPLDSATLTGGVVDELVAGLPGFRCVRSNLVAWAPTDDNGKARYPTPREISDDYPRLQAEIAAVRPALIVALGGLVASALLGGAERKARVPLPAAFSYRPHQTSIGPVLAVHHPAYIAVFKRKHASHYVNAVIEGIANHIRA